MNRNIKALAEAKAKKNGKGGSNEPSSRNFLTSTRDFKDGHFTTGSSYYTKGRFKEYGEGSPVIHRTYRDFPDNYSSLVKEYPDMAISPKPRNQYVVRSRDKTMMRRRGGW